MNSVIEPLYKSVNYIDFGWAKEPEAVTYNMYVGLSAGALVKVYSAIPPYVSGRPQDRGKVPWRAELADVLTTLGITGKTFGDTVFWFAITYVNSSSVESLLSDSTIVEVPPVGITTRYMRDDPTINRHNFVWSDFDQRWLKMAGTSGGSVAVDTGDFFKSNITIQYTYDGTRVSTIKSFPTDATTGAAAKLTTYSYTGGGLVSQISITDSTV